MKGTSQQDSLARKLYVEVRALRKGRGIHGNVRARLGPSVAARAGIEDHDPLRVVTAKLVWLFTQVVARFPAEEYRAIASVELNLRDEGKRLVARRKVHHERGGPSEKGSSEKMNDEIIPEIVRELLSNPPGLAPADFILTLSKEAKEEPGSDPPVSYPLVARSQSISLAM